MNTYVVKGGEVEHAWFVVDAQGQNLGRLATRVATILRGKHKPTYTPSMDLGDFVIVVNADKIQVTGNKMQDKFYYRHSLHPGWTDGCFAVRYAQEPSRTRCRACGSRYVAQESARPGHVPEAQSIRWPRASASKPSSHSRWISDQSE